MTNIAMALKSEIARVARKEVRKEVLGLRKAASSHRSDIAALKRRVAALELAVRRLQARAPKPVAAEEGAPHRLRFTAKGLASQRRRLGLSAQECGLLVGASGQSVYNWEDGKARPRPGHLAAIAALRTMGKKEAAARLAALRSAG